MQKNILIPLVLLTSTSLFASCTKRPTDIPPPPPNMGQTEEKVQESTPLPVVPIEQPVAPMTTPSTETSTSFTRTEKVTYNSPAGVDEVEFTVSVENGVITAASSKTLGTNPGTKMNQDKFAAAVSEKAVGKSIKDFDVDAIGGASLTTGAFEKFVQSL